MNRGLHMLEMLLAAQELRITYVRNVISSSKEFTAARRNAAGQQNMEMLITARESFTMKT